MKTAEPKIIYLQIGEDADITEFEESDFQTNAISWCWERIFPNDIEYVSKQSIIGLIDEMIEDKQKQRDISLLRTDVDNTYIIATKNTFAGWQAALIELKQKIQSL